MPAHRAARHARTAADNIAARLRNRPLRGYRRLGLAVHLGGVGAMARPLGLPLSGLPAQVVARGYHLLAMRTLVARARVAANWTTRAVARDDFVGTGFLAHQPADVQALERTDIYLTEDQLSSLAPAEPSTGSVAD